MEDFMSNLGRSYDRFCVMCGERKEEGIVIHSGFICDQCEAEIVKTEVTDAKYQYIIQKLKSLWLKNA